ncbi:hypothetical protein [Clostridium sp. 'White wine YQ']|uniref:hypothetical protein n=1 Tax=Clostridium sp. 'White wine YQ' TaxID=3027474 RepID=UPI0023665A12|nr:hypothetical protein [Clostridium sp. 'White wine YQ']MDD7794268.1 hypothetical protein [Clostridium sp. 'White wine YQ']
MKKVRVLLIVLLSLFLNIFVAIPVLASPATTFKEGVYKISDLEPSPNNLYTIENISPKKSIFILVANENQVAMQIIKLEPGTQKYDLRPMKPEYRILLIGNGEARILPKT